ncbi:MAG: ZIP family metal transporter [Bacilli bacterium]|nr:ZIP family metal transporter [Bacilli bacterium]
MQVLTSLIISSIAGLSTVLGSIVIFLKFKSNNINKFIVFCLSFSLSIMIGISITDLIPNASYSIITNYNLTKGILICLLPFLCGIILISYLTNKIDKYKYTSNDLYKLGILSMITLMLHNLPEGIATFMSSYNNINLGIKLSVAIMLHNIPEGISIAVPIYYATNNRLLAIKKAFISGLAEPLGAILAFIFLHNYINDSLINIVLILVAGIMITLSINEILPQALKYKENKYIYLGLLIGAIIIIINHTL